MVDTIYAEDEIIGTKKAQEIISKFRHAKVISIERFGEVFNPSNQNFRIQKINPALILARKQKGFVLNAPKGFGIRDQDNYYFSHMYNCLYDCSYCFLQGMYNSANYLVFVNFDDYKHEIEKIIGKDKEKKMTFFTGYDCDSLAMEPVTNFISDFIPFFRQYNNALFEIRTKSINNTVFRKHDALKNCIVAYSLMPETLAQNLDKKAPSVSARIKNMKYIAEKGWSIGLRFDPLIYCNNWQAQYSELFANIFKEIKEESIHSVSLGSLRFPKSFFNKLLQYYPNSEEFSFLRSNDKGIISYDQSIENEMNEYCRSELMKYSDARKFFTCG